MRARHRAGGVGLAALLLALLPRPAPGAEIEVQVSHASDPAKIAGLRVRLLGLTPDGEGVTREDRTDADGRAAFADVPAPGAYLVLVPYAGVRFHGDGVSFDAEAAGARKQVRIEIHEPIHDAGGIVLENLRWFVEQEAGAYRIDQMAEYRNTGPRVVVLESDAPPALRVALAPGHGELRTRTGHTPPGFELHDGLLELRGPVFPGAHQLLVSYDVDTDGSDLRSELFFPDGAASFELYVLDEGVHIDAGRLHAARASRDASGQVYQRYVGFDLPPDTRFPIEIRSLPARHREPVWIQAALVAAIGGALVFFVGRPVTLAAREPREAPEDSSELEKQALYAALRDLEHDFETGKLSAADRDRLREELRRDALRALARVREAPGAAPNERVCACGRTADPDDRFCSRCGSRL